MPRRSNTPHKLAGISVPLFWPMTAAAQLVEEGVELYAKNFAFLAEEEKLNYELKPRLATANRVMLDLRTMLFRDYSAPVASGVPTIVDAPYAGHTAMIADYHVGQSLIETLLANGLHRVFLTDWKSATQDMKDLEIDQYLAEINVCVDDLGGRINLVACARAGGCRRCTRHVFPARSRASCSLAPRSIPTRAMARSSRWRIRTPPLSTTNWSRWGAA
jgi:poly(3-hydroxybutyrate) depolymerase